MRISDWSSDVCSSDLDGTVLEIDCKERLYRATSNAPSLAEARVTVFWSPASCTSARIRISLAEPVPDALAVAMRSEEHTSELQSLMRISYAVFCLKKKKTKKKHKHATNTNRNRNET